MSRPRSTPEPTAERDSDGEGIDARARVRLRGADVARGIDISYKLVAIVFWGCTVVALGKSAPGAYAVVRDATVAMTRVSVALERGAEGTARIEAATERAREEHREMRREMADGFRSLSAACARGDGRR